ncbi:MULTISPECIES: beta-galactosidase [unclassified Streptomyces]|uniref:beta-galactosidase n=1 Tax=unclassified Streptomyces TaxID=2593676 RepID=UPI00087E3048|nr:MULTISPECIES: beta-galactosidase [unclassified Streptomyces]PBC82876.1 beta-galactosidase [Streptomyces sp. 2321.6]SDR46541.1 beta-galactosidase [Streptomyces sp. KS_16]SEC75144.1 beta-galactosidase [Streptomyces sp. 2133.1]SNC68952.1 beta-galactosidase [Streptomyces sp. 2114.4]
MGIHFGGDYNPEQWPEEVWAEDLELMKAARVTMVTAGIFSWARVEPRPGAWDFGWFDRVMDGLAGAGIAVCLATMTASPPPWLSHAHPEILPEDADGRRRWPGGRQHYCPSSPVYRAHALRLVEQLAARYAGHPALAMWHVGNEYGCHTRQCYCEVSADSFRHWLRARYGDIDALNAAWSTAFWSQAYGDFDEVLPPRTAPTFPNPAQQLDYLRFGDAALRACYLAEKAVLERLTPRIPVTTNLMPQHKPVDAFAWSAHMDAMALDFYQDPYAPDDHIRAGYVFDLMRSARSGQPWMLLEQAPGAVNWRPRNGPKPPGAMRLWSWQAVAQGADAVLYFQWRQSLGGAEKFHSAMLPHGGTGTRIFREVADLGRELASLPGIEGTRSRAAVALLADWHSWWALELDSKPSTALDHSRIALDHYRPLFEAGVACDVVPPQRDLSGYRLVVAPNLYLLTADDAARLTAYVRDGGHLLVSFFSGIVDAHDRVHPGGYPGALRELLGLRVEEFWPLDEGRRVSVGGAYTGRADLWSEVIDLEGAEAVARFTDGDLAGRPAVTRHAYGRGMVWYVGTRLDAAPMRALLDDVRAAAGVTPVLSGLPEGVQAAVREGTGGRYLFLLNHGTEAVEAVLPGPMREALAAVDGAGEGAGGAGPGAVDRVVLGPRGVAVLTEPGA